MWPEIAKWRSSLCIRVVSVQLRAKRLPTCIHWTGKAKQSWLWLASCMKAQSIRSHVPELNSAIHRDPTLVVLDPSLKIWDGDGEYSAFKPISLQWTSYILWCSYIGCDDHEFTYTAQCRTVVYKLSNGCCLRCTYRCLAWLEYLYFWNQLADYFSSFDETFMFWHQINETSNQYETLKNWFLFHKTNWRFKCSHNKNKWSLKSTGTLPGGSSKRLSPVSSISSLAAHAAIVSPSSREPPGNVNLPFSGSLPLLTSSTFNSYEHFVSSKNVSQIICVRWLQNPCLKLGKERSIIPEIWQRIFSNEYFPATILLVVSVTTNYHKKYCRQG